MYNDTKQVHKRFNLLILFRRGCRNEENSKEKKVGNRRFSVIYFLLLII